MALKQQKAREKAKQTAEEIVAKLQEGATLENIAEQHGVKWENQAAVGRQSNDVSRSLVSKLFEMPIPGEAGQSVDKVSLPSGDQEIVILTKVSDGEFSLAGEELVKATLSAGNRFGQEEFENYIATLQEQADVVQN